MMKRILFLLLPLAVTTNDLAFPPRPTRPKLVKLSDYKRVKSIGNDYVIKDFRALVRQHNYPAEEHSVTTKDEYKLKFHRIPGSPTYPKRTGKPVLFIQHGLLSSSDIFVLQGPNKDLAFMAVDAGYDVWIGNARGNSYGRSHSHLSPDHDPEFWYYSYHDIALNDIPAMIDYILLVTGEKSLSYIGHSQGTTVSYVLLSTRPEYNSKIKVLISLSPVTFWKHSLPEPAMMVIKNANLIKRISENNGFYEILPQSPTNVLIARKYCGNSSPFQSICVAVAFLLSGISVKQMDPALLSVAAEYNPAGASLQCFLHYIQNVLRGTFQAYDWGNVTKNMERYNRPKPPHYNVKNVIVPAALFYGRGDILSAEAEAVALSKRLPNVIAVEAVPEENFNHIDFLFAKDGKVLLYDRIMEILNQFNNTDHSKINQKRNFSKRQISHIY